MFQSMPYTSADVFNLKNNSAYGKFGENKDNRGKVNFLDNEEDF